MTIFGMNILIAKLWPAEEADEAVLINEVDVWGEFVVAFEVEVDVSDCWAVVVLKDDVLATSDSD